MRVVHGGSELENNAFVVLLFGFFLAKSGPKKTPLFFSFFFFVFVFFETAALFEEPKKTKIPLIRK